MHKYKRLFFSVLLFLTACQGSKAPNGIIKQERMTSLLTEIHIVDGSMYNVLQMPDTLYKYGTGKYLALFKKYQTDSVQFKNSYRYYCSNPDVLEVMYQQVTLNIKQKADSVNKLNTQQMERDNKRRADSLKKLPQKPPVQPVSIAPVQRPSSHLKLPRKNAIPTK